MRLLIKQIKNWFRDNYLEDREDFYEMAKIRLLIRMSFLTFIIIFFSLPFLYLIHPFAVLVSGFGLILIAAIPYLLKSTKSVSLTSKFTLIISFFIVLNVHLIFNKPDVLGVGAWYIVIILCSNFLLGRAWGFGFTVASIAAIFY